MLVVLQGKLSGGTWGLFFAVSSTATVAAILSTSPISTVIAIAVLLVRRVPTV